MTPPPTTSPLKRSTAWFEGPQRPFARAAAATEVVVVRHGSADLAGSDEWLDGHSDAPLTQLGERQAEDVARHLAGSAYTGIWVSTLRRTAQTAAPLAAASGLTPVPVADLREYHLGDYDGAEFERRRAAADPILMAAIAAQRFDDVPGAERGAAFSERVARGFRTVVERSGPGRCVVVTHAIVVTELCRQVTGSDAFAFAGVENASITVVVSDETGWRLRSFNGTAHLGS